MPHDPTIPFSLAIIGFTVGLAMCLVAIRVQIDARRKRRAELDRRVAALLARPVRRR